MPQDRPPQMVLLDLDHTLIHRNHALVIKIRAEAEKLHLTFPEETEKFIQQLTGFIDEKLAAREIESQIKYHINHTTLPTQEQRRWLAFEIFIHSIGTGGVDGDHQAAPNAKDLLETLQRLHIPFKIITSRTNSQKEAVKHVLEKVGLGSFFTDQDICCTGGTNNVAHAKQTEIEALCAEKKINPKNVWYIGDAMFDVKAAIDAHVVPFSFAGTLGGIYLKNNPHTSQQIIHSYDALIEYIEMLEQRELPFLSNYAEQNPSFSHQISTFVDRFKKRDAPEEKIREQGHERAHER